MTTSIDFTKPARLLKTPPGMYRHDGDRFPGLYLNVGKTKSTWYIKRKVDGKTKSTKIGWLSNESVAVGPEGNAPSQMQS